MKQKFLLLFLLTASLFLGKAKATETEPNNTKAQANTLALNGSNNGTIISGDVDWWSVTTTADGKLTITLSALNNSDFYAQLYDNDGITQLGLTIESYNNNPAVLNVDGLAPGKYYIKLYPYSTSTGSYTIANTLTLPTQGNDAEPNNYAKQAITLPLNGSKGGHLDYYYNQSKDNVDWYTITTNADGRLRITLSALNGADFYAQLFDNDTTTQLGNLIESYNNNPAVLNVDGLAPGKYYIKLYPYSTSFGTYTLADSLFTPAQANDLEPNNYAKQAVTLPLNSTKGGHLDYYYNHINDRADWYKVVTNADGYLRITLSALNGADFYAQLYDKDTTTQIGNSIESYANNSAVLKTDGLAAGTYYIKLTPYSNSFGTYTLADSLFTYNANDKEPDGFASQATTLPANQASTGHIDFHGNGNNDITDWWKINYTGTGNLSITYTISPHLSDGGLGDVYFYVYKDTAGATLSQTEIYGSTATATVTFSSLQKGYYYIKVFPYSTSFSAYSITPTFTQVDIATLRASSYDTAGSCSSTNSITFVAKNSSAPYTEQLYRFGVPYGNPITTDLNHKFNNLPTGSYYGIDYGDGATGNAFGKSRTIAIEPIPTGLTTTNIKSTTAKLNWNIVSCAGYFTIQYKKHTATTWTKRFTNGNINNLVIRDLVANTKYDWEVATTDSANGIVALGVYADSISFTTPLSLIADGSDDQESLTLNSGKITNIPTITPNPASSYFTIHYNTSIKDKLNATLFDVNGKAVWTSGALTADALNGKQVNVNQFGSGLYYLKITDSKGLEIANTKVAITK